MKKKKDVHLQLQQMPISHRHCRWQWPAVSMSKELWSNVIYPNHVFQDYISVCWQLGNSWRLWEENNMIQIVNEYDNIKFIREKEYNRSVPLLDVIILSNLTDLKSLSALAGIFWDEREFSSVLTTTFNCTDKCYHSLK